MSDVRTKFGKNALDLILRLSKSPKASISASVLFEDFAPIASLLIESGLIVCDGRITSICDEDMGFVELEWNSCAKSYRYFTSEGWNEVEPGKLSCFKLSYDNFIEWQKELLGIGSFNKTNQIIENILWHIGVSRFGNSMVNFYYLRRSDDPQVLFESREKLLLESKRTPAIIITDSLVQNSIVGLPRGFATLSIIDLLSRDSDMCRLDPAAIHALLGNDMPDGDDKRIALRFSDDYRTVYWNGEEYKLTKLQSKIAEELEKQGGKAHKDHLCAVAGTDQTITQIFKNRIKGKRVKHPLSGDLIKSEGDGFYYFDV